MKLLFQEQMIEFEQVPSTEEVIGKINEFLQDRFYFNSLIADGEEVVEDPEQFLTTDLSTIQSLEIIAVAAKEFINGLLLSTEEYVGRAVPYITSLVDEFYNNPTRKNWTDLAELFEGIQWLSSMIHTVDQSVERPSNWGEMVAASVALQEELVNLEEALKNEDTVLVADMLQYEVLPMFETMSIEVPKIIDKEGTRSNLS